MKKFKPLILLTSFLFALTLLIPALLVLPFGDGKVSGKLGEDLTGKAPNTEGAANSDAAVEVAVYRSTIGQIDNIPLEEYLVGVVAAEMPVEFKEEALKAQALTARTYIVKKMLSKDKIGVPEGAQVTDTQIHQVYLSKEQMRKNWEMEFESNYAKILAAVRATSGQILTYDGQAIDASFFSTSNGYTENSEDYWPNEMPYLRSVSSPWDKNSPKFNSVKEVSVKQFESALGVKVGASGTIGKIVERTAGKRVAKVDFNGKVLSGKDIRDKLDLRSSDFDWQRKGDSIVITTRGYGHGVGMSQYGANGMAAEGKSYLEIVKHYYQGVEVTSADGMMATITAQK
ncbi:stage II sporulation protein D [Neobacillus niacini]|uniref:stage II sporulation protein D n=1 Tax=Neobacillus niacini TaxID=86668 RepID=UPI002FFEEB96